MTARTPRNTLPALLDALRQKCSAILPKVCHPAQELKQVGDTPIASLCLGNHGLRREGIVPRGNHINFENVNRSGFRPLNLDHLLVYEVARGLKQRRYKVLDVRRLLGGTSGISTYGLMNFLRDGITPHKIAAKLRRSATERAVAKHRMAELVRAVLPDASTPSA